MPLFLSTSIHDIILVKETHFLVLDFTEMPVEDSEVDIAQSPSSEVESSLLITTGESALSPCRPMSMQK